METNELILLRLNRLYFFKCAVAKKKKRKRFTSRNSLWKRNVALPYMDLSVENLVNYGWVKLKKI